MIYDTKNSFHFSADQYSQAYKPKNAATDLGFKASPLVFVIIKVYKVNFSLFS